MSHTLRFSQMLASELRDGHAQSVDGAHVVRGGLDTGPVVAAVEIYIPWRFRELKRRPPVVACLEPWMKQCVDWHNWRVMCWVLPHEWRDAMNWKGKAVDRILTEGRDWLLADVRSLVNRHYCAHLEGLDEWPAEWGCWSHGEAGVIEYQSAVRHARNRGG